MIQAAETRNHDLNLSPLGLELDRQGPDDVRKAANFDERKAFN